MKYRKMTRTDRRSRTVTTHEPTITTETATTTWCLILMQKTSLVLISAFPHHLSFSSSSLDQGEREGDTDDSKDNEGDKGSKHSKESKESEDNEGRKGRTTPHKKGQVDASTRWSVRNFAREIEMMIFWAVRVGRVGGEISGQVQYFGE